MRVLISGGGTAGHINPGIAIAKYIKLKHPDAQIIFVGTEKGLETSLVPREGFELKLIRVEGMKRKLTLQHFKTVNELFKGLLDAVRIIKEFKPDIVIGTGGYVCGPVVFIASMMKIPTLIHEQNAYPGITNRLLSRFSSAVAVSFVESKKYFKNSKKLIHTGNPIRVDMLDIDKKSARQRIGVPGEKPLVVVVGGSRGAKTINDSIIEMVKKNYNESDFNIMIATGQVQYDYVAGELKDFTYPSIKIVPYIFNAGDAYSAADLVVCRAGAITSSELTAIGVPSIMIPSPNVTANHQEYNARALEKQGAVVVILDKDLNGNLLYQQLINLLKDKEQLGKMARSAKKAGITNAAEKIYLMVREIMESKKKK